MKKNKKLTKQQRTRRNDKIKELYATGNYTYEMLGKIYYMTRGGIGLILSGVIPEKTQGMSIRRFNKSKRDELAAEMFIEGNTPKSVIALEVGIGLGSLNSLISHNKLTKVRKKKPNFNLGINRKINNDEVKELKRMFNTGQYNKKELAIKFGVHPITISNYLKSS